MTHSKNQKPSLRNTVIVLFVTKISVAHRLLETYTAIKCTTPKFSKAY